MIYIASDHAGYYIKNTIIEKCQELNLQIIDLVPILREKDDYPKIAKILATRLEKDPNIQKNNSQSFGIAICGSGQGIAMGLNRHAWIRAVVAQNCETVKLSRQHNQANVLCFGAKVVTDLKIIIQMILAMKNTLPILEERHQKRVTQLAELF
jgi:ribose 5-phosphate isomerase B